MKACDSKGKKKFMAGGMPAAPVAGAGRANMPPAAAARMGGGAGRANMPPAAAARMGGGAGRANMPPAAAARMGGGTPPRAFKKGGRIDGCATKGKTKGKMR